MAGYDKRRLAEVDTQNTPGTSWVPEDSSNYQSTGVAVNPYNRNSQITKVDGVNAYSQLASLYKGTGRHDKFTPQPGLNTDTGKMPPGKFNPEPVHPYTERNKMGFKPQGPINKSGRTPAISPQASNRSDSTAADSAIHTTWRDLRRELNTGMGARTNKYLLEFDIPLRHKTGHQKLNILCQATSFPAREMQVATMWRFGRQYNLRGETNYGNSWTLTFVDDSELNLRKDLDRWIIDIDDSSYQREALDLVYTQGDMQRALQHNPIDIVPREEGFTSKANWFKDLGLVIRHPEYQSALPAYQTDIRVYQLDQVGNKVMGYVMQNAFISGLSAIDYADDAENQLTKFSITITYSEFLPLSGDTL